MANILWPERNRLLAALPAADRQRLFPQLELVPLAGGAVVFEPDSELRHAYFPVSSMVSLVYVMANGASTEVAVVGREGVIGTSLFMGGTTSPNRAVVTNGGYAYRMTNSLVRQAFGDSPILQQTLLRYTQALLMQMAQTAVCNRHHSLEQQLCRWLLMSLDRLPTANISTTHELISNMLGVRREGVTVAAGKLQDAGVIQYKRGHITVLDRLRLEQLSCECYGTVRDEFDRLLPRTECAHRLQQRSNTAPHTAIAPPAAAPRRPQPAAATLRTAA